MKPTNTAETVASGVPACHPQWPGGGGILLRLPIKAMSHPPKSVSMETASFLPIIFIIRFPPQLSVPGLLALLPLSYSDPKFNSELSRNCQQASWDVSGNWHSP